MARIPYPDPAGLPPENRALRETLPPLNIFRMLSGAGTSFPAFMRLINAYLNDGVLDPELRELVILRVGHLCGSRYEVHQHKRVSRMLGMSAERIEAAAGSLPSPYLSGSENAVLAFTDNQVAQVKADDALFVTAHEHLGDAGMQELVIVIGIYLLVCRYLETFEIEIEDEDIPTSGLDEIRRSMEKP
ncbi:Carboxymuconolactone decarboxylase [Parvibaculum lavamentivorans DS-1]|uniref:Carboxymuconolactone decarboxylase n=1 Tax=Parvibaculum lavamentivorans (strain DS-1 / DSM 13023 / NCIMB 13966) TaxID=402881 RepID=A7HTP4_PARL1|nr:carboxymuconolactone decarboxylase family protein [Parvibaculum lavamentivorans]ABS63277.1 Carboxymuconolactone decarboxylase [Parvibaculum lavamentivorans DS-1]